MLTTKKYICVFLLLYVLFSKTHTHKQDMTLQRPAAVVDKTVTGHDVGRDETIGTIRTAKLS